MSKKERGERVMYRVEGPKERAHYNCLGLFENYIGPFYFSFWARKDSYSSLLLKIFGVPLLKISASHQRWAQWVLVIFCCFSFYRITFVSRFPVRIVFSMYKWDSQFHSQARFFGIAIQTCNQDRITLKPYNQLLAL